MSKVIWLDTETTGLDSKIHGIREIGFIIEIDGVEKDRGLLYINTMSYKKEKYISKYVENEMGVTKQKLSEYPNSNKQNIAFSNTLYKYLKDDKENKFIFAGFNIDFDIKFIKEWFEDCGIGDLYDYKEYFSYQSLDVLALVRHFKYLDIFETENNKLETLCKHFDIEINAHEALSDIVATKKLHEILVKHIN